MITETTTSEVDIEAMSEEEAVELAKELATEGELDWEARPWTQMIFTCGNASTEDWIQSLI